MAHENDGFRRGKPRKGMATTESTFFLKFIPKPPYLNAIRVSQWQCNVFWVARSAWMVGKHGITINGPLFVRA